ncbi:DUF1844 domain-containing protein [Megalodesulfovibrio gigas]|uniref:DUF1844 domain-containing protein n=1 Tax=Megalodesulfovibrio gigas (strain ATCC 19364 / DSM 1382 / NCIMB 9332 / VKM B-1759) TaxID=1121448 RepID=T2G8U5_MEGG1|nr:DUF1844 domain-containing protein [Megalodesulfovibrio gigas]AGW12579.1 hypothetical protein DGI_0673 [Megalodesulfovibrio gigas DSM 1382 = ATCC 19364]
MSETEKKEEFVVHDRRVTVEDETAANAQADAQVDGPADAAPSPADQDQDPAQVCGMPTLPEPNFSTFVFSLFSSCLVHLGEVPNPENRNVCMDLAMAKHTIDTLTMLKEKTAGNLDAEETRLVDGLLYELRMKYVMRKP